MGSRPFGPSTFPGYLNNQTVSSDGQTSDNDPGLMAELFVAIRLFDLNRLEAVLTSGLNLDVVFQGTTPLMYASRHKEGLPVVERLLKAGASVHFHDRRTKSYPLHKAIGAGSLDLIRYLLDAGATATVSDRLGQTPLHFVANVNGIESAALLMQRGADVNARSSSGTTPLHVASKLGHVELARMFLDGGSQVDAMDVRRKATPLRNAVDHRCTDIVEMLLEHGADPNAQAYGSNPLLEAANEGQVRIVKMLSAAGAKVDSRHVTTGETPLIRAAAGGHLHVVKLLLHDLGADINATDAEGQTALIRAIEMNHKTVVDLLIKDPRTNLDAKTTHGWTALHCAVNYTNHHCNEWCVRDLLNAGADPDTPLSNGQTCLHMAAQLNAVHAAAVGSLLLQHGALAEPRDNEGATPLLLAARSGNVALLFHLLDVGVRLSVSERRFFHSNETTRLLGGGVDAGGAPAGGGGGGGGGEDGGVAAAAVASSDALAALRERISSTPSLLQLARRSTREHIVRIRSRKTLRQSIESIDKETLPKMLKNYLLLSN